MKKYCFTFLSLFLFGKSIAQQKGFNLIIGTYTTNCESKGIYVYNFDTETANFSLKATTEKVINPSYLSISPDRKTIYSVNENGSESSVSAFQFTSTTGSLKLINKVSSKGADPCYLINDEKNVIVANYSEGNISVFGKNKNGGLTNAKQVIQHKGKSKDPKRQESPHVHMVQFSPDKKFVFANDLGTDKIYIYKYHPEASEKILEIGDSIAVKRGSGPRHLTFSPNGKWVYLLQELTGLITVLSYENGFLQKLEETQIVDDDFKGEIGAADIHISPDGKFLYATNRGTANDITYFEIQTNGKLRYVGNTSTLGKGPRNFAIDPTGNFLLVGNQHSNTIVIFKRDKTTGILTDSGKRIEVCAPVCLVFSAL